MNIPKINNNSIISDTFNKPKLISNELYKQIKNDNKNTFKQKIFDNIIFYCKKYYINISIIFIVIISLYWRYIETKKKKKIIMNENYKSEISNSDSYESESESINSDNNESDDIDE